MIKKNSDFVLNSLKYIFVSGASKGFNYILLLYLAIGAFTEQYVTILLLISLEQVLSLILPLNNPNIIYSKSIVNYETITNKLISSSIIIIILYVIIFIILKDSLFKYFEVSNILIFFSILLNILSNSYLVYLTNYYKLIEKHQKALLIQGLLMISFVTILIALYFMEDKVLAFFIGKAIGLSIVVIIVSFLKFNLGKFKYMLLSISELKKMFNLLSVSLLGWVSGLGFMNIAKIYSTEEQLLSIGYILNICNVFLLISIGVNSVYNPLIKKYLITNNLIKAIRTQKVTLSIYLLIGILSYVLFFVINNIVDLSFNSKISEIFTVIPFAIVIFVFGTFQSVAHPFYLINDKFKTFNIINIISYMLWVVMILIAAFFDYQNYILFLVLIYLIKALFAYFYAKLNFMRVPDSNNTEKAR